MKKTELKAQFDEACGEIQKFVDAAGYHGGMTLEARVKLLENRVNDIYWFISQLIESLLDDPAETETPK